MIQVVTLAPHKQNLKTRPDWYFKRERYGGILCDIGSHQVDQFLHFTGSTEVTVAHALVENTTMPDRPGFQDFGEITLVGDRGHGYLRLDWFTPDGLPTWGRRTAFHPWHRGHDRVQEIHRHRPAAPHRTAPTTSIL